MCSLIRGCLGWCEGCPIHPTRVDLSLFLQFDKPEIDSWTLFHRIDIESPSVDSTCQKSICARLRKYSWSGLWGWVKNVANSSQFDRIDWSLWPHFKNKEGSCIIISQILTSGGLCRVGWKCCRFESIRLNRHESFPLLTIRHAGSRFARRDSVRIELGRNVWIESNRKMPQTNWLSLGALDMDGWCHAMLSMPMLYVGVKQLCRVGKLCLALALAAGKETMLSVAVVDKGVAWSWLPS